MMRQRTLIVAALALILALASMVALASVEDDFERMKRDYQEFRKDQRAMQRRDKWISFADGFLNLAERNPRHGRAPGCYYWAGFVYRDMYDVSKVERDRDRAIDIWRDLIKRYPNSTLCDDVWFEIARIYESRGDAAKALAELEAMVGRYPQGDMARQARLDIARLKPQVPRAKPSPTPKASPTPTASPTPAPTPQSTPSPTPEAATATATPQPSGPADLVGVRYWSYPTYTRIVVDLTQRVEYKANFLEADQTTGAPRRLYIDFFGAELNPTLAEPITVKDGLLSAVRCGQPTDDIARVVLEFDSMVDYRMFSLDDPFRLVIDASGRGQKEAEEGRIRKIVLDPGHGGHDPGAVGRHNGTVSYEKTYTLDLAHRIKPILERELGVEVVLTRTTDVYVPLEKRTAIANEQGADLFISIHVNASRRSAPSGFSTYYLAPKADPTDEELIALLALENNVDLATAKETNLVLGDLAFSAKLNESSYLAEAVQKSMFNGLRTKYTSVQDRGIKRAPFYVLVGAHMPCILVEAGFITNAKEAGRLAQPAFRQNLAESIARGIIDYVRQLQR